MSCKGIGKGLFYSVVPGCSEEAGRHRADERQLRDPLNVWDTPQSCLSCSVELAMHMDRKVPSTTHAPHSSCHRVKRKSHSSVSYAANRQDQGKHNLLTRCKLIYAYASRCITQRQTHVSTNDAVQPQPSPQLRRSQQSELYIHPSWASVPCSSLIK